MTAGFWDGAEVISVYTRAQAIADGVLVDVTEWAAETGFRIPVAMTRGVWADAVEWTADDDGRKPEFTGQDERGRAHDVLWMLFRAIRRQTGTTDRIRFELLRVPREGRGVRPRRLELWASVGPGDDAEPVVTIMRIGED